MYLPVFICITSAIVSGISCNDALLPIYTPGYSNVYYQRAEPNSPKFHSIEQGQYRADTTEETTESTTERCGFCGADKLNPSLDSNDSDATTEVDTEVFKKIDPQTKADFELEEEFEGNNKIAQRPILKEQGIYYVYHPSGLLQRVVFTTAGDAHN
ncbi:unnamed protein product [Acanthoscelides obtectus]|uniref:Uncharacterized protein n=1 Tax=Acanthoscelides obtectus TaxID=200917 RepID=A0A9P0LS48_ACAOB|nr:unnamed protein product [Acanthoscelides obtectus]CAK1687702.1 hypothetical protein AOBTE_LOCUS36328 [Acanthoscelides obtectus]